MKNQTAKTQKNVPILVESDTCFRRDHISTEENLCSHHPRRPAKVKKVRKECLDQN